MSESVPTPSAAPRPIPTSNRTVPLVVLGLVGLVVAVGLILDQSGFWGTGPRKKFAPDATFFDRAGKPVTLESYRGKIVLLNFWATWCPPCVDEAPSLDDLSERLARELPDVVIVAPAADDEGFKAVDPFIEKLGLDHLTVLHDKKREMFEFGTRQLPETWIIARDGEIVERIVGEMDYSHPDFFKYLQRLSTEGPDAVRPGARKKPTT